MSESTATIPSHPPAQHAMNLLPKNQSILDRPFMQFRPFGLTPGGDKIRDVSGVTIRANIDYLEEVVGAQHGKDVARRTVQRLCESLNDRISNPAYHVTDRFLRNAWNSYSYEFTCYLGEFCILLSDNPRFQFEMGKHKFISPIIQTLGRPFSVSQIFKMFPHFGEKFAKGSILYNVQSVTNGSAVLRMKFTDHVYEQFGPYRKRCADIICQAAKAGLLAVPQHIHHLGFASVRDLQCIADGDEYCEWEFRWPAQPRSAHVQWTAVGAAVSGGALGFLRWAYPEWSWGEAIAWAIIPGMTSWFAGHWYSLTQKASQQDHLINEQVTFVNTHHEELREAYLEQERTTVELRHKVSQLTTLYQTGLGFSATLDREALLENVLHTIMNELKYDRVMITFFDRDRQMAHDARLLGAPSDVIREARNMEVPVDDPASIEGEVLLQGRPLLINDLRREWDRLHPLNRELAQRAQVQSCISVPLKRQKNVLGSLTVNHATEHALTQDDLHVMVTVANQIAIALDNADAYHQIASLNVGLEKRIQERTSSLQAANEKLRELDQLKSAFVSIVSHELRTPLTAIKGLVENMRDGFTGALSDRQVFYLTRVTHNIERLTRMLNDLLDLSRIEAGRMELTPTDVSLVPIIEEVLEALRPQAEKKSITLHTANPSDLAPIRGDRDKILQILMNLTHNAIKFTPPSGRISITITTLNDHTIEVCVADTGCGIAPEDMPRVFDRFYRSRDDSTEARGAGLGLAITKSLVELHHGHIRVDSTPDNGSRFSFTLPTRDVNNSDMR